jgi:glycosyltransferase involved in cell wall biosynthesis
MRCQASSRIFLRNLRRNLQRRASPIVKQAWLRTVGAILFRAVDCIAVLSDREEREFRTIVPSFFGPAVKLRWGIDEVPGLDAPENYYRDTLGIAADGHANIVFWARLDWHYKGLDRLLAGVLAARKSTGSLPFRLFLCGPGYAGGLQRAEAYIAEHSLQGDVRVITSFGGSKAALRDADASVLLSRWDGLPRSLRESLWLGVPVIASHDTHAEHLLCDEGAGIVVEDPDQPEQVAEALLAVGSPGTRSRYARNAQRLKPHLSWDVAARNLIADLRGVEARLRGHHAGVINALLALLLA